MGFFSRLRNQIVPEPFHPLGSDDDERDIPRLDLAFYVNLLKYCGVPPTEHNVRALVDRVRLGVNGGWAMAYLDQTGDLPGKDEFMRLFHHPKVAEANLVPSDATDGLSRSTRDRLWADAHRQAMEESGYYEVPADDPELRDDTYEESRQQLDEDYILEADRMIDWLWEHDRRFREPLWTSYTSLVDALEAPTSFLRTSGQKLPAF